MSLPADLKIQGREELNCLILSHLSTYLKGLLNEIKDKYHILSGEFCEHLKKLESQWNNYITNSQIEIKSMINSSLQYGDQASRNQKLQNWKDLHSLRQYLQDLNHKSEAMISLKESEVRALKLKNANDVKNTMSIKECQMQNFVHNLKSQEERKKKYLKKIIMKFSSDLMVQNKTIQFKQEKLKGLLKNLELNVNDLNEFLKQQQYKMETRSMLTDSSFDENSVCSESLKLSKPKKSKLDLYRVGYI